MGDRNMSDTWLVPEEPKKKLLAKPRRGRNVWPGQCCPYFEARHSDLGVMRECWYCQYADFHLKEPVSLDVGICCYPKVQLH